MTARVSGTGAVVAHDDHVVRETACKVLATLGYHVHAACDGAQALEALDQPALGLAIVDLRMPKVDGIALIRCIRASPRTRHLPIVVVTSRDDRAGLEQALDSGATAFVAEPIHWPSVAIQIRYLMRITDDLRAERRRGDCAQAASRLKDAAIAGVVGGSLPIARDIGQQSRQVAMEIAVAQAKGHAWAGGDAHRASGISLGMLHEVMARFRAETARIEAAVTGALDLSRRLSADINREDVAPEALEPLLLRARDRAAAEARARGVGIDLITVPADIHVCCHASSVTDAMEQVIRNAVLFSPAGARVEIATKVHEDGLLSISVSDEGTGMDPAFFSACLSPPSGGLETPPEATGTQCEGIAFVKAVAEAHGGALEIHSMPQRGTTVILVLPAERVCTGGDRAN